MNRIITILKEVAIKDWIAIGGVVITVGAGWGVMQSDISGLKAQAAEFRTMQREIDSVQNRDLKDLRTEILDQLKANRDEIAQNRSEIVGEIRELRRELHKK